MAIHDAKHKKQPRNHNPCVYMRIIIVLGRKELLTIHYMWTNLKSEERLTPHDPGLTPIKLMTNRHHSSSKAQAKHTLTMKEPCSVTSDMLHNKWEQEDVFTCPTYVVV